MGAALSWFSLWCVAYCLIDRPIISIELIFIEKQNQYPNNPDWISGQMKRTTNKIKLKKKKLDEGFFLLAIFKRFPQWRYFDTYYEFKKK